MVKEKINKGIAIIVPSHKILDVLNQPMIKKAGKGVAERLVKENLPAADGFNLEQALTLEDFGEALRHASRKTSSRPKSESDETS